MFPAGIISLWFGSIGSIPAGWVICDGNNGTPDLRDKFVIGAGGAFAVDDAGGATTHDHTFSDGGHTHDIVGGIAIGSGAAWSNVTASETVAGTTDPGDSMPPFHALAYIMKT